MKDEKLFAKGRSGGSVVVGGRDREIGSANQRLNLAKSLDFPQTDDNMEQSASPLSIKVL